MARNIRKHGGTNEFGEVYAPAKGKMVRANEVSARAMRVGRNADTLELQGNSGAKMFHASAASEHQQAAGLLPKSDPRHAEHTRLAAHHASKALVQS
jgi:hypothetical protein